MVAKLKWKLIKAMGAFEQPSVAASFFVSFLIRERWMKLEEAPSDFNGATLYLKCALISVLVS